jgi:Flp pilus assembly protein CpaB
MKLTSLLMAAIGMSFAGGSAFVAYDFMETRTSRVAAEQRPELVEIMIAAQDIPFGESIEAHMITAAPLAERSAARRRLHPDRGAAAHATGRSRAAPAARSPRVSRSSSPRCPSSEKR